MVLRHTRNTPGSGTFPCSRIEIRTEPCLHKYGVKFQQESAKYMKTMTTVLFSLTYSYSFSIHVQFRSNRVFLLALDLSVVFAFHCRMKLTNLKLTKRTVTLKSTSIVHRGMGTTSQESVTSIELS